MVNRNSLLILFLSFIASCSSLHPEMGIDSTKRVNSASVNQLFGKDFEEISYKEIIRNLDNFENTESPQKDGSSNNEYNSASRKWHRNELQYRIIAASNNRCNLFKTYITRINQYSNVSLGSLTTIFGTAGAAATGEKSARILSALAGTTGGIRAEVSQSLFESLASSIIVPGIDIARKKILDAIKEKHDKTLIEYPIQAAIADAINYHGTCSLSAGIGAANKSLNAYNFSKGLATGNNIQDQIFSLNASQKKRDSYTKAITVYNNYVKELSILKEGSEDNQKIIEKHNELIHSTIDNITPENKAKEIDKNFDKWNGQSIDKNASGKEVNNAILKLETHQNDVEILQNELNRRKEVFTNYINELKTTESVQSQSI